MENQLSTAYYASSAVMNPSASKPINYQEHRSTSGQKNRGVEEGSGSLFSPRPRNGMKTRFLGISPLLLWFFFTILDVIVVEVGLCSFQAAYPAKQPGY